ncbi:MAG: formate dehydrogenase accessory sulfurtransferase FdhD [Bacteroidota bacterium]
MLADKKIIFREYSKHENLHNSLPVQEPDWIANEIILTITVNNELLTNFSCSPDNLEEMAVGFIFTSNIISCLDEIKEIQFCRESNKVAFQLKESNPFDSKIWQKHQTITSGCGQGKSFNTGMIKKSIKRNTESIHFSPNYICELFSDLRTISQGYKNTGCIHIAALIKPDGPSIVREDIGRHNAIDKVIGAGLRLNLDFSKYILCCSGRISSDMILKAGRAGVPIVASRAAPTGLAVEISNEIGITLIGFVRGNKLNIYTHSYRVSSSLNTIGKRTQEDVKENSVVLTN